MLAIGTAPHPPVSLILSGLWNNVLYIGYPITQVSLVLLLASVLYCPKVLHGWGRNRPDAGGCGIPQTGIWKYCVQPLAGLVQHTHIHYELMKNRRTICVYTVVLFCFRIFSCRTTLGKRQELLLSKLNMPVPRPPVFQQRPRPDGLRDAMMKASGPQTSFHLI